MTQTQQKGRLGEQQACHYLKQQGLKFIAQNFSCRSGEIDLIMRHQQYLVFVEVRVRYNESFGHSISTVNYSKQQRIIKAAQYYLLVTQQTDQVNCRFDIVGINGKNKFTWIKNAFEVQY